MSGFKSKLVLRLSQLFKNFIHYLFPVMIYIEIPALVYHLLIGNFTVMTVFWFKLFYIVEPICIMLKFVLISLIHIPSYECIFFRMWIPCQLLTRRFKLVHGKVLVWGFNVKLNIFIRSQSFIGQALTDLFLDLRQRCGWWLIVHFFA